MGSSRSDGSDVSDGSDCLLCYRSNHLVMAIFYLIILIVFRRITLSNLQQQSEWNQQQRWKHFYY